MSKYTTEVRFICEEAAGLDESKGFNDVENIVNLAYPKIFSNSLEFYNEETKARLLPKILLHYYQREIAFETVGLWKLYLNNKMREILPYYNQLYKSEELEYNPLKNVDNTHTHTGSHDNSTVDESAKVANDLETRNLKTTDDGSTIYERDEATMLRQNKTTSKVNNTSTVGNDTTHHTIDADADHWVMFSDTPQGGINGVQLAGGTSVNGTLSDNSYLTNATHETTKPAATTDTTQRGNVTGSVDTIIEKYNDGSDRHPDTVELNGSDVNENTNLQTGTIDKSNSTIGSNNRTETGTEDYTKTEEGKIGVMTYQEMQMKWRESFLNIDMQIIDELGDLFMKVW